ncbi:glycosyltransferase family 4 protein [Parapedobacter pyrenivorans]|nr:glycosyltransferase family 4 protein [Parapedobacter pyrenivorans]
MEIHQQTITIVTTCGDDWGGSEELWSTSACLLKERGDRIVVCKDGLPRKHTKYVQLAKKGIELCDIKPKTSLIARLVRRAVWRPNGAIPGFAQTASVRQFSKHLSKYKPDLVVVSQGINFDGLGYAYACLCKHIRYVIISQKAVDFYWPSFTDRSLMKEVYDQANKCYFVSKHNLRLTEEQFGLRLKRSQVIFNPVKISRPIPFPAMESVVRICCIARLFILDKGQDILLRILSKPLWKSMPIHITFVGRGEDEDALREMAELLDVENITFLGFKTNVSAVWESHHALILPSRSEGLPLTIVEAMRAGRPVITTAVGGNAELLTEGETGFIGGADELSFEAAMLRAWEARDRWEEMGKKAALYVDKMIPEKPERDFVNDLMSIK